MPVVRGADDVKIAQRFIAGVQSGRHITPRSGRLKIDTILAEKNQSSRGSFNLSRPFHGLSCKSRLDPSTQVLGFSHFVRSADEALPSFFGKARPGHFFLNSRTAFIYFWKWLHKLIAMFSQPYSFETSLVSAYS
jgi:hypothetical protein